jgi:putative addiction module component (TIGR02574 family)
MLTENIKKLSKSEKLLLVGELWDDIADTPEEVPLTKAQEQQLDERYQQFRKNPEEGEPWAVVKDRIKKML